MSTTFFTSDTHFGHKNILRFEPASRPFDTLEEMHETMIDNWNKTVTSQDVVWHLGDVCFGQESFQLLDRLKGTKKLVLGNHDQYGLEQYVKYFSKIYGVKYWNKCILTHVPVHCCSLGNRAILNVHGHIHSKLVMCDGLEFPYHPVPDDRYLNVGVDRWDMNLVAADYILNHIKSLESIYENR